jgi:ATP-dependent protease ClpP protease subunit
MAILQNLPRNRYSRFVKFRANYQVRVHRKSQVMEDTDRDFFMSAQEAVEYGLIDAVIEHPTHLAVNSSGIPMFASEF